jgi:hypothetical protein
MRDRKFLMPDALSGSSSNLYFSFEAAGVHFLMLGSYTDLSQIETSRSGYK